MMIAIWVAMSIVTYFMAIRLMRVVYSRLIVACWSAFLWPVYLPLVIVLAARNP